MVQVRSPAECACYPLAAMPESDPPAGAVWEAVREGSLFFMGNSKIDHALEALVRSLDEARIPYCLVGAMALNRHGYRRFTEDIDLLMTREGHAAFKSLVLGRGYVEKFPGSKTCAKGPGSELG